MAYGESSVDFEITWGTSSKSVDIRSLRDQMITDTKRTLDAEGIELPFPYRTVFKDEENEEEQVDTPRAIRLPCVKAPI
ncbi:MAG TPA: mechanosensitive ion channel family protein [Halomonas sp.]|nr:mechanosensitive ion channel family protein [Halomonas sp.]